MQSKTHIEKMIDAALESADNLGHATAKPYLFTRISARMDRLNESGWEKTARLITKPSVVIAGLCMIICVNAAVIAYNNSGATKNPVLDQLASSDDYSTSVTALYYNENSEP